MLSRLNKLALFNRRFMKPTRIIALGFLLIIIIGTLLLMLPISTTSGEFPGFIIPLFTATSATCVTGLTLVDTHTYWSAFGQIVIITLVQVGGIGFMTLIAFMSFLLRRTIGLRERLIMMQALNLDEMSGVVRLVKHILIGTLIFEGIAAVIMTVRFSLHAGIPTGIYSGIFHSISAFCNAGFDLMGGDKPFWNLVHYPGDIVISITVMVLIIVGGVGFFVWEDVLHAFKRRKIRRIWKNLHLHTKLVLTVSAILIFAGAVFFYISEYNNPKTLGEMDQQTKIMASAFQSISARTAGFAPVEQGDITTLSKSFTIILMFIGGSPGSASGGVKTVSVALVLIAVYSVMRGRNRASVFGRTLAPEQIMRALTLIIVPLILVVVSSLILGLTHDISLIDILFETVSAMSTTGYTVGVSPMLNPWGQFLLVMLMYFGRIGIITISIAMLMSESNKAKTKYPNGRVFLG